MTGRSRANGEGSIFPYRNGYAAYVWVRTPEGLRKKKWVYGKTRDGTSSAGCRRCARVVVRFAAWWLDVGGRVAIMGGCLIFAR